MPTYSLPDLPYDPAALEPWYAAEVVELHHSKHHQTYVDGANETLDKLEAAREKEDFATINQLEKNLAFHVSGHVLHSIFWTNLTPDAPDKPSGALAKAIDEHLGGFEACKQQMNEVLAGVQGSGWGALAWEPTGGRLIIEQVYDHQGNVGQGAVPIFVIDAWEHAYYLQYRNVKADFFDAVWNIVNWDDVARRLTAARKLPPLG